MLPSAGLCEVALSFWCIYIYIKAGLFFFSRGILGIARYGIDETALDRGTIEKKVIAKARQ